MIYRRNARKPWTKNDDRAMRRLAGENTSMAVVAFKLGRTHEAVRVHARQVGVSLRQRNLKPYVSAP